MSVRDTLMGSAAAYAIAAVSLLWGFFGEGGFVAAGEVVTLAPLVVAAYSGIVGTGLLVGAGVMRKQHQER